jgi:hypothetical protein
MFETHGRRGTRDWPRISRTQPISILSQWNQMMLTQKSG